MSGPSHRTGSPTPAYVSRQATPIASIPFHNQTRNGSTPFASNNGDRNGTAQEAGPSRLPGATGTTGAARSGMRSKAKSKAKAAEDELHAGSSLFGPGWREVEAFEDMSDEEDYSSDEEEYYAVLDLGSELDHRTMAKENTFQLIGLETSTPFLKLGNQVYHGKISDPIGDEIILERNRNPDNPTKPSYPPSYKATHHLSFRPIVLKAKSTDPAASEALRSGTAQPGDPDYPAVADLVDPSTLRTMTMQAPAPFGPNRGRKELMDGIEAKERDAGTGRFAVNSASARGQPAVVPATAGKGKGKEKAAPRATSTAEPGPSRDMSRSREETPLRSIETRGLGIGAVTPKIEPDLDQAVVGPAAGPSGTSGQDDSMDVDAPAHPPTSVPKLAQQPASSLPPTSTAGTPTPSATRGPAESPTTRLGGSAVTPAASIERSDLKIANSGPLVGPAGQFAPRRIGRPPGSGKPKRKFHFESEDALRAGMTMADLAQNPIVELVIPPDPKTPDDPSETLTLTKKQVLNVLEGRPVRGKGSRAGIPGFALRTRQEKIPVLEDSEDGAEEEGNPVAGPSAQPQPQSTPASRRESGAGGPPGATPETPAAPSHLMFKVIGKDHSSEPRGRKKKS